MRLEGRNRVAASTAQNRGRARLYHPERIATIRRMYGRLRFLPARLVPRLHTTSPQPPSFRPWLRRAAAQEPDAMFSSFSSPHAIRISVFRLRGVDVLQTKGA